MNTYQIPFPEMVLNIGLYTFKGSKRFTDYNHWNNRETRT